MTTPGTVRFIAQDAIPSMTTPAIPPNYSYARSAHCSGVYLYIKRGCIKADIIS